MSVTRRDVFEYLATMSDAENQKTTTITRITTDLNAEYSTIKTHLEGLSECDLARFESDEEVCITTLGEQLLELDIDDIVIIDTHQSGQDGEEKQEP